MWSKAKRLQVGLVLLVVVAYVAILLRNVNESDRRSLHLQEQAGAGDSVLVSIRITDVNTDTAEMTAGLSFRLAGTLAKDEITPAADLKLLLNNVRGPQEFDFPRGRRLNPILAVFSLDGNVNRYPFDAHAVNIRMLITTPGRQPPAEPVKGKKGKKAARNFEDLLVGTAALQRSKPVPIVRELSASIPGVKFQGQLATTQGQDAAGIELNLRRSDPVIVVSVLVMLMMMSLAMSVLAMAIKALTSDEKLDLLPLSLSVTLLFGLPALRNAQPDVPPLGAFSDYVSFLWAELIVAVSAVLIMWAWLRESPRSKREARS